MFVEGQHDCEVLFDALRYSTAWFTASCPPGAPIDDLLGKIEVAAERHFNCWFYFGPGTMRSGKPILAYCFEGEFFTFELDEPQARLLKLAENHVDWGIAGRRLPTDPRRRSAATLAPPQILVANIEQVAVRDSPGRQNLRRLPARREALMPVGAIEFNFKLSVPDAMPLGALDPGASFLFFVQLKAAR